MDTRGCNWRWMRWFLLTVGRSHFIYFSAIHKVKFTHKPRAIGQIFFPGYFLWNVLALIAIIIINIKKVSILACLEARSFHSPSTRRSGFVKRAQPAIVQVQLFNSVPPSAPRRLWDWQGGKGGRWIDERADGETTTPERQKEKFTSHRIHSSATVTQCVLSFPPSALPPPLSFCCAVAGG